MDKIDQALFEAWMRVGEKCRANRAKALVRFRRRRRPSVSAPVRQWCLCIRAADTRIDSHRVVIAPLQGAGLGPDCGTDDLVRARQPHRATLSGALIRQLTAPVRIPWPGVPLWEAEKMLGMSRDYVRQWVRGGALEVSFHDYCKMHGKHCKPIPRVFTPRSVDPQMPKGAEPDGVWGSLWQWKGEMLPENFEQTMERVPRFRTWKGANVFRGWDWRCPGRPPHAADGEFTGCGRVCKYVYAPLPPVTLAASIGEWALEMPEGSGLKGAWQPGMQEVEVGKGRRSFACKHCWGVRNPSMLCRVGWNEFVSYISGGLLYGREVERPADEAAYVRKHRFGKRRSRKRDDAGACSVASAKRQA